MAQAPTRWCRWCGLLRTDHRVRSAAAANTAAYANQAQRGGVAAAAGTAIAAMPNPMSASAPAVRRCSSTGLRIRNRQ